MNEMLDPGRSPKTDKSVILADAIRMVTQLRNDAAKLKDSSQDLLVKINELKVNLLKCCYLLSVIISVVHSNANNVDLMLFYSICL